MWIHLECGQYHFMGRTLSCLRVKQASRQASWVGSFFLPLTRCDVTVSISCVLAFLNNGLLHGSVCKQTSSPSSKLRFVRVFHHRHRNKTRTMPKHGIYFCFTGIFCTCTKGNFKSHCSSLTVIDLSPDTRNAFSFVMCQAIQMMKTFWICRSGCPNGQAEVV